MRVPTHTPPLRVRLYYDAARPTFRARRFADFATRYRSALSVLAEKGPCSLETYRKGTDGPLRPLKSLGLRGKQGWVSVADSTLGMVSVINDAESNPSARLPRHPSYDLHLAVTKAGSPKKWIRTPAALWLMCQSAFLWGRELGRFADAFAEEVADKMYDDDPARPPRVWRRH